MGNTTIEFQNFGLTANSKAILTNINLAWNGPGLIAISARSGAGKSTLLLAVTGLLNQRTNWNPNGKLLVDGLRPNLHTAHKLRRKFMYVPQNCDPLPFTVEDNLTKIQLLNDRHLDHKTARERSIDACRLAQMPELIDEMKKPVFQLSGGQKQRLTIARSLVQDPAALLLDEPTSSLDPVATAGVLKTLMNISQHKLVVIVTHNLEIARKCNLVYFLGSHENGGSTIISHGTPNQVFDSDRTSQAFEFAHSMDF